MKFLKALDSKKKPAETPKLNKTPKLNENNEKQVAAINKLINLVDQAEKFVLEIDQISRDKKLNDFYKENLFYIKDITKMEEELKKYDNNVMLIDGLDGENFISLFRTALDSYVGYNKGKLDSDSLKEITLFYNAATKLESDYKRAQFNGDSEKEKDLFSQAKKLFTKVVLKIEQNEKNIYGEGKIFPSPMSDEMKNDLQAVFGDLNLDDLNSKAIAWDTINFFNDFLKYSHNKYIVRDTINDYVKVFHGKPGDFEETKKSAKQFCTAVMTVLGENYEARLDIRRKGVLPSPLKNFQQEKLVRDYFSRQYDKLDKAKNIEEIGGIINNISEFNNEFAKCFIVKQYKSSIESEIRYDIGFKDLSSHPELQKKLEEEYGMPLDLLLTTQDMSDLKENKDLDVVESDDNKLNKLIGGKKVELSDDEKTKKETEANDLRGFVLKNNPDYNDEQISNINLLVDIFVYLDKDDLFDSIGPEKRMAKVAEFVKIFNDSMEKAKDKNPELAEQYKKINFFSGEMKKAVNKKNYRKFGIFCHRLKSIFLLVITLGISKNAREGLKQPLLNLRKNTFEQACENLRKELEEKKIIKDQGQEK